MLTTNVERLEGANIKLTVTVSADEVNEAIKKAYSSVSAKIRIPGFRKGRAPRPVVDTYMGGREHMLAEATEALVEKTYPRAIDEESLRPIDSPEIDGVESVVEGEDYTYVAQVELRPELALTHVDDFGVTVVPKNVTEAQIDEQIQIARDRFASLEPIEGRVLAADDFALISFVGDLDGESYEGNQVDKYLYELGRGQMPTEFDEGLLGMEPGQDKRVEFVVPDSSSSQEHVGKTAGFEITLHEIKAKVLPEVDDEFAVSLGGYDDVAQMREDLRTRMQGAQEQKHERAKEEALRSTLAERLVGDVPEAMVRTKTSRLLRDFKETLDQRDMTLDAYLDAVGISVEAFQADLGGQAAQVVKEELALDALFRALGMEITDDDVTEEVAPMVSGDESVEGMLARWREDGLMPILHEQIVQQRAMKWLLDNGTITENDGTDAASVAAANSSEE